MENRLKTLLRQNKIAMGAQLRFGSPAIAELFGHAGFDFCVIDCEHAPQTIVGVQSQLQAIGCTKAAGIVRIVKNDPEIMRPFLDMGAQGFVVPFVLTGEEARLGVSAMKYPPIGTRGWGPARASQYGYIPNAKYRAEADDSLVFLPIIEDKRAVDNIDAIVSTEGLDSFIIGPVDLSFSLGKPFDFECPKFRDAIKTVEKAARAAKKPLGTSIYGGDMFNTDTYKKFVDRGYTLLLIGGDEWMLNADCRKVLDSVAPVR